MYGQEKWIVESNALKRWGYRLFGELHVPGRIRGSHILREISRLGLSERRANILDAGSGRGDLAIALAARYPHWTVTGIELSQQRLDTAQTVAEHLGLRNIEFRRESLENLAVENQFDLIISADVLEHIEEDRTVLKNLFRALRPGGFLIVTSPSVPQRKHLALVRWRERWIGFQPSDYGHVRQGYGRQDIQDKFREAGGRLLSTRFTFGFFGTLAFDIFFVIGDDRSNPFVFAALFPFLLVLGYLDLHFQSAAGSGILAVGTKD